MQQFARLHRIHEFCICQYIQLCELIALVHSSFHMQFAGIARLTDLSQVVPIDISAVVAILLESTFATLISLVQALEQQYIFT